MRKIILTFLFFLIPLMSYCIAPKHYHYWIVGKGDSGQYECDGTVEHFDRGLGGTIEISINDMITKHYHIVETDIIDERTISYKCRDEHMNLVKITKYKCPHAKNVYFFSFPPLYNGQGRTTYKTTDTVFDF